MVKGNSWNPPPRSLLVELSNKFTPPPSAPPSITPRKDPPGTPFPFLSLPRELRDLVYAHFFHTDGIHYRTRSRSPIMHWQFSRTPASHIPLLLTSRQLHTEAQPVLYRTRTLELAQGRTRRSRHHVEPLALDLSLRGFPTDPARWVSYVHIRYWDYTFYGSSTEAHIISRLSARWAHVVRDAHTLRAHFPRLRRFEARYCSLEQELGAVFFARLDGFHEMGAEERGDRAGVVVRALVGWLESLGDVEALVPPAWLRVLFGNGMDAGGPHVRYLRWQDEVMMRALREFKGKKGVSGEEKERSGRMWLEGLGEKRKRGRKGWWDDGEVEKKRSG